MRAVLTEQFVRSYIASPAEIQKTFGKQLALFLRDWRHPSLQAKKFDATRFQARVTQLHLLGLRRRAEQSRTGAPTSPYRRAVNRPPSDETCHRCGPPG